MSFKQFDPMDIYNIVIRWHSGYKIREISRALQIDRKTVRRYIKAAEGAGLGKDKPLPENSKLMELLASLTSVQDRPQPARNAFERYRDEIVGLISNKSNPLKPKTAYEVICERHGLVASYSTFKRFIRDLEPGTSHARITCRLETPAGEEVQIDYAMMGNLYDPLTKKQRRVYAFIATLSFCRLKYVEFVYRQDQRSFVFSHQRMMEFFGGVPRRVVIDNLKDGVIKSDLYDPKLNRLYQELGDHYGFFIDPARVRRPKDKGKVERSVQIVREMFRKLKALHSDLDMATANKLAFDWARHDNGMKVHGTTGLKPFEVFCEIEKTKLLPLPTMAFQFATWREAKVHADQFIQFEKKFYSLPEVYVGQSVWVRGSEKLVAIFDQSYQLIRQYPKSQQTRLFDASDFPDNVQVMMTEQGIQTLISRAQAIGPNFKQLIIKVLTPHAKLNYRRALALLNLSPKYRAEQLETTAETAIRYRIFIPQQFKRLLQRQNTDDDTIPISHETQQLVRSAQDFIHSNDSHS